MGKLRKVRKLTMMLAAFFIVSTILIPHVRASGTWQVSVLVAYDEEWETTANLLYAYSAETLAKYLIWDVEFFSIQSST